MPGSLGLGPESFRVFEIPGFRPRLKALRSSWRAPLEILGRDLQAALEARVGRALHPHQARHPHGAAVPPEETWVGWSPARSGAGGHPFLALCASRVGLHARIRVAKEARDRARLAKVLAGPVPAWSRPLESLGFRDYRGWDFRGLPPAVAASPAAYRRIAAGLSRRGGGLDLGCGWPVAASVRLTPGDLLEALGRLAPLLKALVA